MDETCSRRQKVLIYILSIAVILLLGIIIILFVRGRVVENITVERQPAPPAAATSSESAATSTASIQPPQHSSYFSYPYPLTWDEGADRLDLTGVTLGELQATPDIVDVGAGRPYPDGAKIYALTLILKISTGNSQMCLPLNMRRVINEFGDLAQPNTTTYDFPDVRGPQVKGYCPSPNSTFDNQKVIFAVDGAEKQYALTTGGRSNTFFFITVQDDGTLKVEKAPTSEGG